MKTRPITEELNTNEERNKNSGLQQQLRHGRGVASVAGTIMRKRGEGTKQAEAHRRLAHLLAASDPHVLVLPVPAQPRCDRQSCTATGIYA
jgi:hypothetical protein